MFSGQKTYTQRCVFPQETMTCPNSLSRLMKVIGAAFLLLLCLSPVDASPGSLKRKRENAEDIENTATNNKKMEMLQQIQQQVSHPNPKALNEVYHDDGND